MDLCFKGSLTRSSSNKLSQQNDSINIASNPSLVAADVPKASKQSKARADELRNALENQERPVIAGTDSLVSESDMLCHACQEPSFTCCTLEMCWSRSSILTALKKMRVTRSLAARPHQSSP